MKKISLLIIFAIFFIPRYSIAALFINEIFYNPQGTESGHEWVEVCSNTNGSSLSGLQFEDSYGSKRKMHNLEIKQGASVLQKDQCAVIVSDDAKFKADFPNMSGTIMRSSSSFSLSNSGEELAIYLDSKLQDAVNYSPGGKEGESIHRDGANFVPAQPTPGNLSFTVANAQGDSDSSSDSSGQNSSTTPDTQISSIVELPIYKFKTVEIEPPQDIFLRLPKSLMVYTGENLTLKPELFDARGKAIEQGHIKVVWGDLSAEEKDMPAGFTHVYKTSGDFMIFVAADKGSLHDSKSVMVHVSEPALMLTVDGKKRELYISNMAKTPINLKGWHLKVKGYIYKLPEVFVAPSAKLTIPVDKISRRLKTVKQALLFNDEANLAFASDEATDNTNAVSEQERKQEQSESALQVVASPKNATSTKSERPDVSAGSGKSGAQRNFYKNRSEKTAHKSVLGFRVPLDVKAQSQEVVKNSKVESKKETNRKDAMQASAAEALVYTKSDKMDYKWLYVTLALLLTLALLYLIYVLSRDEFEDWQFDE